MTKNDAKNILQKHIILYQHFRYQNIPLNNKIPYNVQLSTLSNYTKRI